MARRARQLLAFARRRPWSTTTAAVVVLAVVAALTVWITAPDNPEYDPNRFPFDEAVATLATAPGLQYKDTAIAGITSREVTVAASGALYGTLGDGVKDQDKDVLRVGGAAYTRNQQSQWFEEPDNKAKPGPGPWTIGKPGSDRTLDPILAQYLSPVELAGVLWEALNSLDQFPDPDDSRGELQSNVDGVPALGVDTAAGRLTVTRSEPHRVLRLEPYNTLAALQARAANGADFAAPPDLTLGPLKDGDSEGLDLTPITGALADIMFDTLEKYTKRLSDAVDAGFNFKLDTDGGKLDCGSAGCQVTQPFTGDVSVEGSARLKGGKVSATMTATVTVEGEDAGSCTSPAAELSLTGSKVSGTLSCFDEAAGPIFSRVEASKRAEAERESRAAGGATVRYRVDTRAQTNVHAHALAVGEVDQLVAQVQRDRDQAVCSSPHSFPRGTRVLLPDGSHRAIEQIRIGDQVATTDPEHPGLAPGRVVDVILTDTDTDFTRLTVATDQGPAAITATDNHPFWLINTHRWTDARNVRIGDQLRSSTDSPLPVTAVADEDGQRPTADLTISGTHTYYVLAGETPVLVHNSPTCPTGTMVPYNGGGLASQAWAERQNANSRKFPRYHSSQYPGGNVAVAKVNVDGKEELLIGLSAGSSKHSEIGIIRQIDALRAENKTVGPIIELYSERQPCTYAGQPGGCQAALGPYVSDGTVITWSVPWDTPESGLNRGYDALLAHYIRRAAGGS